MDEIGGKLRGRTYRRWIGGLTTVGAMGVVALMALSSAASAGPGIVLKGATPILDYSGDQSGCATSHMVRPGMSMVTGAGHMYLKGTAKTCFPVKGGYLTSSFGEAFSELGAAQTQTASKAYTSFNATFNVTGSQSVSGSGKISHCPVNYENYTFSVYNGSAYGTEMFSYQYQDCYAEAGTDLFGYSYVEDLTTSTYYYGYGSGMFSDAGQYADNYTETFNYTNPTFGTNATYSCTTCYGTIGTGGTSSLNFNMYLNTTVSIAKGDKVTVEAYIYGEAYTEMYRAKAGNAMALLDLSSPGGHVDLTSFGLQ